MGEQNVILYEHLDSEPRKTNVTILRKCPNQFVKGELCEWSMIKIKLKISFKHVEKTTEKRVKNSIFSLSGIYQNILRC